MKKYYIETYGCQMNFAQSSQLVQSMNEDGFVKVGSYKDSDVIIINACSVRKRAEDRVFQRINLFNIFKKKKNITLLVTGCFAQNNKDNINADIVMGSSRMSDITKVLNRTQDKKYLDVNINEYEFFKPVREEKFPFRTFIDITKGCNNYCTYCIVPYVRGPQLSRTSIDIENDVKRLADNDVKEIVLLGQNVNTYGKDNNEISFSELLYKLNQIDGIKRIKFLTSHPKDFSSDIISAVFNLDKVIPYFHLPIQSGSNKILKLMNRKYTLEDYHKIIEELNSYNEEYSLSTDLLVGFPCETEKDFQDTIDAVKSIKFNEAFMFKYSPRPNIEANKFEDTISEEIKSERLQILINTQKMIEKTKIKESIGKIRNVLIEDGSRKDKEKFIGRDELNYQVIVDEKVDIGSFNRVSIFDLKGAVLFGKIINEEVEYDYNDIKTVRC